MITEISSLFVLRNKRTLTQSKQIVCMLISHNFMYWLSQPVCLPVFIQSTITLNPTSSSEMCYVRPFLLLLPPHIVTKSITSIKIYFVAVVLPYSQLKDMILSLVFLYTFFVQKSFKTKKSPKYTRRSIGFVQCNIHII